MDWAKRIEDETRNILGFGATYIGGLKVFLMIDVLFCAIQKY